MTTATTATTTTTTMTIIVVVAADTPPSPPMRTTSLFVDVGLVVVGVVNFVGRLDGADVVVVVIGTPDDGGE